MPGVYDAAEVCSVLLSFSEGISVDDCDPDSF